MLSAVAKAVNRFTAFRFQEKISSGPQKGAVEFLCQRARTCAQLNPFGISHWLPIHLKPAAACAILIFSQAVPTRCLAENSEAAPLAAHALLLDVANTGDTLVAVGDHGDIVISGDNGLNWTQATVPTRALLTAVFFVDAKQGWAVGHEGVILVTADGGQTWRRQDNGKNLETVFLDVHFLNSSRGFAIGAYGKFISTNDGGKTWTATKPSEDEVHFNRFSVGGDGSLYLAGENGTLLFSQDGGEKWSRANVPYDGSLFGVLPLGKGELMVYGLRGHILRSDDHGATWEPENSETKVLISCGLRLKSGLIVLGGQGGNFFLSRDGGHGFATWKSPGFSTSVAGMAEANDGVIVTVGEAGAVRIKLP